MKRFASALAVGVFAVILSGCAGAKPQQHQRAPKVNLSACNCPQDSASQSAYDGWPIECSSALGVEYGTADTFSLKVFYFTSSLPSAEEIDKLEKATSCCTKILFQIVVDSSRTWGNEALEIKPGEPVCKIQLANYECRLSGHAPAEVIRRHIIGVLNWGRRR